MDEVRPALPLGHAGGARGGAAQGGLGPRQRCTFKKRATDRTEQNRFTGTSSTGWAISARRNHFRTHFRGAEPTIISMRIRVVVEDLRRQRTAVNVDTDTTLSDFTRYVKNETDID